MDPQVGRDHTRHNQDPGILTSPESSRQQRSPEIRRTMPRERYGEPKNELFMMCYTGLLHCAQQPTAALMQSFDSKSPVGDMSLHMFRAGPSLAYSYIIRSLSHIPLYLLHNPRGFREINFDLTLDEVLCARGAITKGRM